MLHHGFLVLHLVEREGMQKSVWNGKNILCFLMDSVYTIVHKCINSWICAKKIV